MTDCAVTIVGESVEQVKEFVYLYLGSKVHERLKSKSAGGKLSESALNNFMSSQKVSKDTTDCAYSFMVVNAI